jgi:hypothetical protein
MRRNMSQPPRLRARVRLSEDLGFDRTRGTPQVDVGTGDPDRNEVLAPVLQLRGDGLDEAVSPVSLAGPLQVRAAWLDHGTV